MKVFLSSNYHDWPRMKEYRDIILAPIGISVTSRWIEGTHEIKEGDFKDHVFNSRMADEDIYDLKTSDVMVAFTNGDSRRSRGGRHVEFGYALAIRKPIIIFGDRENVFHFHDASEIYRADTDQGLVNKLLILRMRLYGF